MDDVGVVAGNRHLFGVGRDGDVGLRVDEPADGLVDVELVAVVHLDAEGVLPVTDGHLGQIPEQVDLGVAVIFRRDARRRVADQQEYDQRDKFDGPQGVFHVPLLDAGRLIIIWSAD